jgi:polyketide biosynthesis enoyl-CoA hydratase PksI
VDAALARGSGRHDPLVSLTSTPEGIATITLNDSLGRNALSALLVGQLLEVVEQVNGQSDLKVVILRGLPEVFCSGASRDALRRVAQGEVVPGDLPLTKALLDLPLPCIAAMEGHAVGGGLALGLCSDIVLIARESRYGCSFMNMGFTPGMGTTRLLEHVFSRALAHEMMLTGQMFKGMHFEGRSGFNYILPRSEVMPKAQDLAARIAEKPRVSLMALKRVLSRAKRHAFEDARTDENLMHEVTFGQPEIRQMIEDNFDR